MSSTPSAASVIRLGDLAKHLGRQSWDFLTGLEGAMERKRHADDLLRDKGEPVAQVSEDALSREWERHIQAQFGTKSTETLRAEDASKITVELLPVDAAVGTAGAASRADLAFSTTITGLGEISLRPELPKRSYDGEISRLRELEQSFWIAYDRCNAKYMQNETITQIPSLSKSARTSFLATKLHFLQRIHRRESECENRGYKPKTRTEVLADYIAQKDGTTTLSVVLSAQIAKDDGHRVTDLALEHEGYIMDIFGRPEYRAKYETRDWSLITQKGPLPPPF